jgi:hypothetical protein
MAVTSPGFNKKGCTVRNLNDVNSGILIKRYIVTFL